MTDSTRKELIPGLKLILKYTFWMELTGAIVLRFDFWARGEDLFGSLWRGVFTAISAFCNAGFALQSDSLCSYSSDWVALLTISTLIILGGMAPATALFYIGRRSGGRVPVTVKLVMSVTAFLLILGTLAILVLEWNGVLKDMSITSKLLNAWFQSVTLRTAGFNSVDIAGVCGPVFMLMLLFMLIGGSPGGTAGGIKTTAAAVIAFAFVRGLKGYQDLRIFHRRIPVEQLLRAIAVVVSAFVICFLAIFLLEETQQIPLRDIIFEVFSALGTVGLSTGATGSLDQAGKVIIMLVMFAGRIGPLTLFMLFSVPDKEPAYPEERISIS